MKQNEQRIEDNCKKAWQHVYEERVFEEEREIK